MKTITDAKIILESNSSMDSTLSKKAKLSFNTYRNLTFFSLMTGYAGYYLCRQNLGVAYAPLKASLGIDAIQFGWISSVGTLTYAIGKVVVGSLADSKLGGKFIFYLGLFVSSLFCLIFGLGKGISFFLIAWSFNRFFQSMGWSGLINVMSRWFTPRNYGTAMGFMSISYQFGGVLVSLYAGLILSMGGTWQSLFIIPAITLMVIGLVTYPFMKQDPADVGYALQKEEHTKNRDEDDLSYFQRFSILLSNKAFLVMLGLSFILTFLRECFSVWMPAYFTEMGETASLAAFKSTIFPFLGCIGTLVGGWVSDRFLAGRRSPIMASLLLVLIFCLLGLSHVQEISSILQHYLGSWATPSQLALILVGATGFFLLGSYSFVGGVVALDFGGRKTAGTAAGLLDGVGYLGATLAGIGIAQMVIHRGWNFTFSMMAASVGLAILFCLYLWNFQPHRETSNSV